MWKLAIDIYFPGKLSTVISFGQMYKQGVLSKIMESDLKFFIMQAELLITAEGLCALVCSYETIVSWWLQRCAGGFKS